MEDRNKKRVAKEAELDFLKAKFIKILSEMPDVTFAAKAAGIPRASVYYHRRRSPEFAEQWDEAIEMASDKVSAEVFRRGVEGTERKTFFQGRLINVEKKCSDRLLALWFNASERRKLKKLEVSRGYDGEISDPVKMLEDYLAVLKKSAEEEKRQSNAKDA